MEAEWKVRPFTPEMLKEIWLAAETEQEYEVADVTIEALEVEDLGSFHACAKCETANSNLHRVFQLHIVFCALRVITLFVPF